MQEIINKLTAKDDKFACAYSDMIIAESRECDTWYEYFDAFATLLNHPKSLVRNRALHILAANARWDEENRFDAILPEFLSHVTDEKPITAHHDEQSIRALPVPASALGLIKAAKIIEDGRIDGFIADRYASYNSGIGAKIRAGETTLEELAAYAEEMGAPALPGSGRQEYLESIVNNILFCG